RARLGRALGHTQRRRLLVPAGPPDSRGPRALRGGLIDSGKGVHPMADRDRLVPRLERAFEFAGRQVRATIERTPDYFPIYTVGGRREHGGELWTDWCGGFHAGMMWLIAERTGDPWWRDRAEHYSRLLEPRQH